MGLTVLSKELVNTQDSFKNIALAALNARLFFAISGDNLKRDGAIQYINIKRYFGRGENDYDILLTDILSEQHSKESKENEIDKYKGISFYPLLATNDAPSKLSYDFSLAYLRLCPEHLISIYDCFFSLEDIETLERNYGWYENWYQDFNKLDI